VDVLLGGPGQSNWKYLSQCASMDGPSVPKGDTELRYCQDPDDSASGFVVSSKIKRTADQATGNLMTKLGKLDHLADLDCPFSLRARFNKCGARQDPTVFDPIMIVFCDIDLTSEDYSDLVAMSADDNDEIVVTAAWSATTKYRVKTVVGARAGSAADFGDIAINDFAVCDSPQCAGYCGKRKDGCSVYHGVTDLDTAPYGWPSHIQGIKDVLTDVVSWTNRPIIGVNGNVENVECAGDRVVVSSNSASLVAYNETYDDDDVLDQDGWNMVAMTYAPAAYPNALYARTSQEVWVATDDGYVGKSVDAGETWTYTAIGGTPALRAVFAYDADLVYVGGANGQIHRSTDGGSTWTNITEVATFSDNILVVRVPPGRSKEVYVGTDAGGVYRSENQGAKFTQMAFAGDDVGTIDDLEFCGPCNGDVLWILQNDAGPRGRILRDMSGGKGGADVREEVGYTAVISAGVELNALACCDANTAWAAGEANGGYPAVFKVS
jgi:hypothetical protein